MSNTKFSKRETVWMFCQLINDCDFTIEVEDRFEITTNEGLVYEGRVLNHIFEELKDYIAQVYADKPGEFSQFIRTDKAWRTFKNIYPQDFLGEEDYDMFTDKKFVGWKEGVAIDPPVKKSPQPQPDIIGKKIGRLTVLCLDEETSKQKKRKYYWCRCECGTVKSYALAGLKNHFVNKSCGCYHKEMAQQYFQGRGSKRRHSRPNMLSETDLLAEFNQDSWTE